MRPQPAPAQPAALDRAEEHLQADLRALDELRDICLEMARLAQEHTQAQLEAAAAEPGSGHDASAILAAGAAALERAGRGLRRAVLLKRHLLEANPTSPAQRRTSARKRILRQVEDTIHREVKGERAERLRAELLDRLDSPDLEDEIDDRPVEHVITDILRDLGIAGQPGVRPPWKRRTPDHIAILHARAARPPGASASAIPDPISPDPIPPDPEPTDPAPDDDPPPEPDDMPDSVRRMLAVLKAA